MGGVRRAERGLWNDIAPAYCKINSLGEDGEPPFFPLDSPPFRRANFPKFRPCKTGSQSFHPSEVFGPARRRHNQHPREETASCGEEMRKEGRSGRAGALRTGEKARKAAEVLSLSLSLSQFTIQHHPILARQTDRRLEYQSPQRHPLVMRGTTTWR